MDAADSVPLLAALPFAVLLLAIATLPLVAHSWWESDRNRGVVAAVCSAPVAWWCLASGRGHDLVHALHEYEQFIVMLGALYVVSGGIYVAGGLRATPGTNCGLLALGAVLASVVGTTGASMLLIRPLLRANGERRHRVHTVIFFIFLVSNCGGLLTPIGDPPLFMGYLRGVPFTWTFHLWPNWLAMNAALLAIYFVWDSRAARSETPRALGLERRRVQPLRVSGALNLVLLVVIVASVALVTEHTWLRDAILVACALISLFLMSPRPRARNRFRWAPIAEVAILFAGIFVTVVPAIRYLEAHGAEFGLSTPRQYFWATGSLSAFLDNAPTYLTLASVAAAYLNSATVGGAVTSQDLRTLIASADGDALLAAISLGAVFMGAMTYIGNGPNFMVKAIAESERVPMPSFFGYLRYSVAVLVPLFVMITVLML